eukprot:COSAG01_NODE_1664_length_9573_cov_31.637429_3_plen_71_part_00
MAGEILMRSWSRPAEITLHPHEFFPVLEILMRSWSRSAAIALHSQALWRPWQDLGTVTEGSDVPGGVGGT